MNEHGLMDYSFQPQELIMLFLLKKSLKRQGSQEVVEKLLPYCDFWKTSSTSILKIFMSIVTDYCKTFPVYFRNSHDLLDEIIQILVSRKMAELGNTKEEMERLIKSKVKGEVPGEPIIAENGEEQTESGALPENGVQIQIEDIPEKILQENEGLLMFIRICMYMLYGEMIYENESSVESLKVLLMLCF